LDDDVGPHAGQFPAQGVKRSWSASVEVEHKHIVRVLEDAAKPLDLRGRPVRELGPQIPDLQIEAMALALARSTAWRRNSSYEMRHPNELRHRCRELRE
jgi:hypothetical protein